MSKIPDHLNTNHEPHHSLRKTILRPVGESFDDLYSLVKANQKLYSQIEKYLAPYNAKQIGNNQPYSPPTREFFTDLIRITPQTVFPMSEFQAKAAINSTIRFCEKHRGHKQLANFHHSTHHSFQLSVGQFLLDKIDDNIWNNISGSPTPGKNVYKLSFPENKSLRPVYIENYRPGNFRFLIVRQMLVKTGIPSTNNWEVLFFRQPYQHVIDWIDAKNLNPRWVGKI